MEYFRITAYHPTENYSMIIDSNGMFEKLWQFSAFLVQKGFKIIEVSNSERFKDVNIPPAEHNPNQIILRACDNGLVVKDNGKININDRVYVVE